MIENDKASENDSSLQNVSPSLGNPSVSQLASSGELFSDSSTFSDDFGNSSHSDYPEKIAKDFIEDARKKCLQGDYNGALSDCLRAIDMNPFYSKAHRQHGMVLYLKNNLDDAEIAWKKAWECDCRR